MVSELDQWKERHALCQIGFEKLSAENVILRDVMDAAKRWRRAFHHGTREEIELQERCLLDILDQHLLSEKGTICQKSRS